MKTVPTSFLVLLGTCVCLVVASACKRQIDAPESAMNHNDPLRRIRLSEEAAYKVAPLSTVTLDMPEFLFTLRVGRQSFLLHTVPVLATEMPVAADYLEIMRCPDNAVLFGGSQVLAPLATQGGSLADRAAILRANDFWGAGIDSGSCILIATNHVGLTFADTAAPSGTHAYLARACVDPDRLVDREATLRNCSRLVARSGAVQHTDTHSARERALNASRTQITSSIDALGRRIVHTVAALHEGLFHCQERHARLIATARQQAAMNKVLSGAAALGVPALAVAGAHASETFSPSAPYTARLLTRDLDEITKGASQAEARARLAAHIDQQRRLVSAERKMAARLGEKAHENQLARELDGISKARTRLQDSSTTPDATELRRDLGVTLARGQRSPVTAAAKGVAFAGLGLGAYAALTSLLDMNTDDRVSLPRDADTCYADEGARSVQEVLDCGCAQALRHQAELEIMNAELASLFQRAQMKHEEVQAALDGLAPLESTTPQDPAGADGEAP